MGPLMDPQTGPQTDPLMDPLTSCMANCHYIPCSLFNFRQFIFYRRQLFQHCRTMRILRSQIVDQPDRVFFGAYCKFDLALSISRRTDSGIKSPTRAVARQICVSAAP